MTALRSTPMRRSRWRGSVPQTFANAPVADEQVAARGENGCTAVLADDDAPVSFDSLATLKPIGQVRDSFILAVNPQGLWIIDQHVAHERVLFEKILKQRMANSPERQQMLMPLLVELTPSQMAVFAEISDELNHNGFEVEPFGTRTIAVKTTAAGVSASRGRTSAARNPGAVRARGTVAQSGEDPHQHRRAASPAMPPSRSTCRWSRTRWSGCYKSWRRRTAR